MKISRKRICPRCRSQQVIKNSYLSGFFKTYICDKCNYTFRGMNLGWLRLAL